MCRMCLLTFYASTVRPPRTEGRARRRRWRSCSRRRSRGPQTRRRCGLPPDNNGELGLVVGLLGYGGYPDGLAWPYNRIRVYGEDDGLIGDIRPRLCRVVLVVEAYADDFLGPDYRGVDADFPERHRIFTGLRTTAVLDELDHVLVAEGPYLLALQGPDPGPFTTHGIRNQLQELSSPRIRDASIRILAATRVPTRFYGCRRTIFHPLPERW